MSAQPVALIIISVKYSVSECITVVHYCWNNGCLILKIFCTVEPHAAAFTVCRDNIFFWPEGVVAYKPVWNSNNFTVWPVIYCKPVNVRVRKKFFYINQVFNLCPPEPVYRLVVVTNHEYVGVVPGYQRKHFEIFPGRILKLIDKNKPVSASCPFF